MLINEQMEQVVKKYGIARKEHLIYGSNIPNATAVLPTPWGGFVRLDEIRHYFFYFDEYGIFLYTTDGESSASIPWSSVVDFKVSHVAILGKITVWTADSVYRFQTNRFVFGCPWISANTKRLESKKYFYRR